MTQRNAPISCSNPLPADQYIHDNTEDELTHGVFTNAFLVSKGRRLSGNVRNVKVKETWRALFPRGFALPNLLPLIDRGLYPTDPYPDGMGLFPLLPDPFRPDGQRHGRGPTLPRAVVPLPARPSRRAARQQRAHYGRSRVFRDCSRAAVRLSRVPT
jgi:hypothetical protein